MKRFTPVLVIIILAVFAFVNCENPALKGAKIYITKNQLDKAKEQLEIALEATPDDPEVNYLLGSVYLKEKNYVKMNEYYDKCLETSTKPEHRLNIELDRNRAFNMNFNGAVRILNASFDEQEKEKRDEMMQQSVDYLTTALEILKDARAYEARGTAYLNLGEHDKAKEDYKITLVTDPQAKTALLQMGVMLYNEAHDTEDSTLFGSASKYYEKYLEFYPDEKMAVYELAYCYEKMGKREEAIAFYESILSENPGNVDVFVQYGVSLFGIGDTDGAIAQFMKALAIDPENLVVNKNIAFPLFYKSYEKIKDDGDTREEWEEILPYMMKVSELEPNNADAWEALAIIYIKLDQKEKSDEAMLKAKELREKGL